MEPLSAGAKEGEGVSACRISDLEGCQAGLLQPCWEKGVEQGGGGAPYNSRLAGDKGSLEEAGEQVGCWSAGEPKQSCLQGGGPVGKGTLCLSLMLLTSHSRLEGRREPGHNHLQRLLLVMPQCQLLWGGRPFPSRADPPFPPLVSSLGTGRAAEASTFGQHLACCFRCQEVLSQP